MKVHVPLALACLILLPACARNHDVHARVQEANEGAAHPIPCVNASPFGIQVMWPAKPEEEKILDHVQAVGAQWGRFDLCWWSLAEQEKGVYDFTGAELPGEGVWDTDETMAMLEARGIEPLPILCYSNPHYDEEKGPYTDEGRRAFGDYCYAAAKRYADQVTYWMIWNEPNLEMFWGSPPNAADYAKLTAVAAKRVREADPDAIIVGGIVSTIDRAFLDESFEHGLLDHIDVLGVHPYRIKAPETINGEIRRVRELMKRYTKRDIPIWTDEWGYNTAWTELSEIGQAKALSRMFVNNLSQDIELSIWFSAHPWVEAKEAPDDPQWGIVDYEGNPRPIYYAMKTAIEVLAPPVGIAASNADIQARVRPRLPRSRVETFYQGDGYVVALWREGWPLDDPDAYPIGGSIGEVGAPAVVEIETDGAWNWGVIDGVTGREVAVNFVERDSVLELHDVPLVDYPIYIVLQPRTSCGEKASE